MTDLLIQQIFAGLSSGAIYACMALAVVMIYQVIGHVNFAQGEMAMLSTFMAWQLMQWGAPYWLAFVVAVAGSFVGGVVLEQTLYRPLRDAKPLSQLVLFVGMMTLMTSSAGFIWDFELKAFPSPFGNSAFAGSAFVSSHQIGMMGITLLIVVLLYLFFRHTRMGLALRASAENPVSAKLVGIKVGRTVSLGWGMAASIGAVAGIMTAPTSFVEPYMMQGVLVYGFAGAVLGGLTSAGGAVVGGLLVGLIENLAGAFIPLVGRELKLSIALLTIVLVLVVKPGGIFARNVQSRV